MKQRLFLDIETAGDPWDKDSLLCIGWALEDQPVRVNTYKAGWQHDNGDELDIARYLADPSIDKVTFTKYDLRFLMMQGWKVKGQLLDAQVMAWVLNENTPLDLDWLAKRYAGITMDKRLNRSGGAIWFRCDDGTKVPIADAPLDQMVAYNKRDVAATRDLFEALYERLTESEWDEYWETEEVPYSKVLLKMETRGLPINLDDVEKMTAEVEEKATEAERGLKAKAGLPESFNLNSQQQMNAYLFSRAFELKDRLAYDKDTLDALKSCAGGIHEDCDLGETPDGEENIDTGLWLGNPTGHVIDLLPEGFVVTKLGNTQVEGYWPLKGRGLPPTPKKKDPLTGKESALPSVSSPDLLFYCGTDEWVHELCTGYRKYEKVLNTYLRVYPKVAHEGRIYGGFKQTGTVTGRLSSSGPNLQNQPSRGALGEQIRSLFQAAPGTSLIVGDYDQLEMRLFAHFSGDPRLTKVFRDGLDPHLMTAQGIFGQDIDPHGEERYIAKQLNYAMGYGAGAKKVAQMLSLMGYPTSKEEAAGYLEELSRFYRGFFRWKQSEMDRAKRKGSVRTIGGRLRRLRGTFKDTANWKLVSYGERQAVNFRIQGTAADIIRRSMVLADRRLPEVPMLAQVHDEVIFESRREGGPHVETLMEMQSIFETLHGFKLEVPLIFEPHVVSKWADKGVDAPDLELLEEDE